MNNLTKALLGSVGLSVLAAVPATAHPKHPAMHLTALHEGKAVNKTRLHNQGATHVTYTFGVYSYIPFAEYYRHKLPLRGSFYKWNNSGTLCSMPDQKIRVDPKKTTYGRASIITETYSIGCPSGPTTFYGVAYKITDPNAEGQTDEVHVILKGKFHNGSKKYRGTLNLDLNLTIQ